MVARVIAGERNGAYGLWVSKPGYDVFTAPPGDLMFDSDAGMLQVVAKGTLSIPAGQTISTIPLAGQTANPLCDIARRYFRNDYGWVTALDLGDLIITGTPSSLTFRLPSGKTNPTTTVFSYIVYGTAL